MLLNQKKGTPLGKLFLSKNYFFSRVRRNLAAWVLLLPLTLCQQSDALTAEGDLRAQLESSRPHRLIGGARWEWALSPRVSLEAGTRLSVAWPGEGGAITWPDVDAFHYLLGLNLNPFSFVAIETGILHTQRFQETYATSHGFGRLKLHGEFFDGLSGYFSLGWYERWVRLDKVWAVPTFRGEIREHDFTFAIGLETSWIEPWKLSASLATFDALEIFNLTHPFVELRASHPVDDNASFEIYSRYQVLLGFGRLDALMLGATVRISTPDESSLAR